MVQKLCELNNTFYRTNYTSFSRSREAAWQGWERVAQHLYPGRLLDIACGNMRFERFLEERFGEDVFLFTCVDACSELAKGNTSINFVECDVLAELLKGKRQIESDGFDIAVSFGFMHHIPSNNLREEFMRYLVQSVQHGGVVAVSFWQFMCNDKLAKKAQNATDVGTKKLNLALEEGDYLFGWNNEKNVYRYCHHFTNAEIDAITESVSDKASRVDRFNADGRDDALNSYVILRRW